MSDSNFAALAAVFSSALLVALLFSFAVFRDAPFGAASALATSFIVYLFQLVHYSDIRYAEDSGRAFSPSSLSQWLFLSAFVTGSASAILSLAGV